MTAGLTRWFVVGGFAVAAVACSPSDESVVAVEPIAGAVVDESGAAAGAGAQAGGQANGDGLRTSAEDVAAPAPPTLSPDAAVETSAVTAPVTAAPTTASPAPAAQPTSSDVPTTVVATSEAPPETTAPPEPVVAAPITAEPVELEAGELQSFTMLNDLRASLGLPILVRDPEMDAFARDWSRQMAETQQFEHSDGSYGENIAFTSNVELTAAEAADAFHQLWVESSEHYANMVNERYVSAGIGLYLTPNGWYGTHVFTY